MGLDKKYFERSLYKVPCFVGVVPSYYYVTTKRYHRNKTPPDMFIMWICDKSIACESAVTPRSGCLWNAASGQSTERPPYSQAAESLIVRILRIKVLESTVTNLYLRRF